MSKKVVYANSEEKRTRRMEIAAKYQMTKNIRNYMFIALFIGIISIAITWWGFSDFQDSFFANIDEGTRNTIGWIGTILAVIGVTLSAFLYYVFRNAKKHVLGLIDFYDTKFPSSKYDGTRFK